MESGRLDFVTVNKSWSVQ